jgi:hypothetical protein
MAPLSHRRTLVVTAGRWLVGPVAASEVRVRLCRSKTDGILVSWALSWRGACLAELIKIRLHFW